MATPTFTEVWLLLNKADRAHLAELEAIQDEILAFLHTQPADDVGAPMFTELQAERLSVYRTALDRKHLGDQPSANP